MTCIVGLQDEGKVWIGGDSAAIGGYSITTRNDEKVFTRGPFVFGFAGSFRMGQLLRYDADLSIPDHRVKPRDLDAFMVNVFIAEVRKSLRDGGYTYVENNNETGGTFLVGVRGTLYAVHSDFQVARSRDGYQAIGCGEDLALGSLHTSHNELEWTAPAHRLRVALRAAAHHSAGVCPPFKVVSA